MKFWPSTTAPARIGSVQTRTLGMPSTVIWQLAQWPEQHWRPRGRWYLKLREKTRRPEAKSAEPIVSPRKPLTGLPPNEKSTSLAPVDPLVRAAAAASRSGSTGLLLRSGSRQPRPQDLVREVFRSARNQSSQTRQNHHSRWTPASLALK